MVTVALACKGYILYENDRTCGICGYLEENMIQGRMRVKYVSNHSCIADAVPDEPSPILKRLKFGIEGSFASLEG